MTEKERMLQKLPFKSNDEELINERIECKKKIYEYNNLAPERWDEAPKLLENILGSVGENPYIEQPFRCDYGYNTHVGDNFYANYNLVVLDIGKVTIGNNVMIAPNVGLYAVGHPIHHASRNSKYEYGADITIGDNVWIGGHCCVMPGVTIGSNTVIGGGSVVAKDIPSGVVAVGNPCKVVKKITDEDKHYYFRDNPFDVDDYLVED